jgi:hypothetical protein
MRNNMGYRLHACIPNVKLYEEDLVLGKQYDEKWDTFNDRWFETANDHGIIYPNRLEEFYKELIEFNTMYGEYKLYNLEELRKMFDYAIEHNYCVYFSSY